MANEVIPASLTSFNASQIVSKTITFTGAANLGAIGNVPIFTVTGTVLVRALFGTCGTTLASTGAATLALGSTNQTAGVIAATTATNITSTNSIWATTTPTRGLLDLVGANKDFIVTENVVGTVAAAPVSAGVLTFVCVFDPMIAGTVS